MSEDLLDDRRLQDRGDKLQLAAAVRAVLKVELEDALEQPGPTQPHRTVMRTVRLARKEAMTQIETQRVRLAAKDLLHRLIEAHPKLLVQDWHKDNQTQHKVRSEIQRVLDQDLPASYDRSLFKQKCDTVFDLALGYAQRGKKWAA